MSQQTAILYQFLLPASFSFAWTGWLLRAVWCCLDSALRRSVAGACGEVTGRLALATSIMGGGVTEHPPTGKFLPITPNNALSSSLSLLLACWVG